MAFECRLLGVVRLSIFGRFVFLESAISIRFVWDFSEIWICGLYILLNLVKRARLPNCRILLTRHDFVTSPRPVASLGVPAIATLGVLHVRQHVNELFCGEAGIEPLLAPKNRYPTYWFFYSVALPLSYSPAFTSWISKSELSHFPGRIFDRYTSCNRI